MTVVVLLVVAAVSATFAAVRFGRTERLRHHDERTARRRLLGELDRYGE